MQLNSSRIVFPDLKDIKLKAYLQRGNIMDKSLSEYTIGKEAWSVNWEGIILILI